MLVADRKRRSNLFIYYHDHINERDGITDEIQQGQVHVIEYDFLVREAVASFYDQSFNRDSKAKVLAVHLMDLAHGQYEAYPQSRGWL
jgi:hypothetical protein